MADVLGSVASSITIPKMLKLIEEQTDGLYGKRISLVVEQRIHTVLSCKLSEKGERELKLLERNQAEDVVVLTSDDSGSMLENQWSYSTKKFDDEMTATQMRRG
ncbi:MAG: hypothetical protein ACLVGQ_01840 [Blautia massiliensis (ex Durand et al. 2017)]|uniref:hypothetical protein n=1 Tax=Blautia massiliensis (ex Durand et al. 2017) TaxID=1737424 RepID=UPI00399D16DB